MADLFTTAQALPANRLAEHRVRTLPSLVYALQHLTKVASDRKCGAVNLADIDPLHGAVVSLNVDDRGLLYVAFEGMAS
ncbi:hypothetical protein AWL63_06270 [Sphingomonas panacis]|uniref:Uncharacterized protein n=1 Tax=Sphingomonas panacis TaxID=1560345 RepID=A0A1B3Z876_9SPHN|nr:hypothetical protein [Sphingomonas panacis]AOH83637.1 hypothetical protein AWL63_06270 [Sphingomonas panacis]